MTKKERALSIIQDIRCNHMPRVLEGLDKGYIDENQIMVILDHAMRARILQETCELCNGTGIVTPGFVNLSDPCPCTSPCICPPSTNETIPGCPIHAPR